MKYLLSVIAILWGINVYAQLSPAPQGLDNYKCIDTTRFEIHYSFKFKTIHPRNNIMRTEELFKLVEVLSKIIVR